MGDGGGEWARVSEVAECCSGQQWPHSDNESRAPIDRHLPYNKPLPSCVAYCNGQHAQRLMPTLVFGDFVLAPPPLGNRHEPAREAKKEKEGKKGEGIPAAALK